MVARVTAPFDEAGLLKPLHQERRRAGGQAEFAAERTGRQRPTFRIGQHHAGECFDIGLMQPLLLGDGFHDPSPLDPHESDQPHQIGSHLVLLGHSGYILPAVIFGGERFLMRMNHINLSVPDVQEARCFLEKYFGLRFMDAPTSSKIVVALDEGDCIIALSNFSNSASYSYPAAFHVGFNLPTRADVDAMHERLTADGYKVGRRKEFHGAWTFYFDAPGGFVIEVLHQGEMAELKAATRRAKT